MSTILNIASGKRYPLNLTSGDFLVQLDPMYGEGILDSIVLTEIAHNEFNEDVDAIGSIKHLPEKANEFMEKYKYVFDKITCYRYLEHVPFTEVLYFIYLMSTTTPPDGVVDIIVPDYAKLSAMLLREEIGAPGWENENIIITTEMVNDPGCPHASVWTVDRLKYFFELEKRFEVIDIQPDYEFDGRDIYIRGLFKNIVTT